MSEWLDRTPAATDSLARPSAAEDCAAIYDPADHSLVLFGGKNDQNRNLSELWRLDLDRRTWNRIQPVGEAPPPTEDHSLIYDPLGDRLILFGGENGPTCNQVWSFEFKARRWRSMADSTAPFREDHTAIFDSRGKRMVVFGGQVNGDDNDDLWALNLDPQSRTFEKWSRLAAEADHPGARDDHVAVYDSLRNRMIVYGGWNKDAKEYLGDTWALDFASSADSLARWHHVKTKWSHPPKRRHAVGVYDSRRDWLILYGGFGEEGYLNDVWALVLGFDLWINVTPGPQPRLDAQGIYDPAAGHLVLYGGDARLPTKFHDLWELQVDPGAPVEAMLKVVGSKHGDVPLAKP
ncbi:MAG TPA: kelch repeat-containing protein [Candidatus Eisenbacteria bacterium]